jgi:hypothetical protein
MLSAPLRRKILVLNDKKAIRNLFLLLEKIACEQSLTPAGAPLPALPGQTQFDAVVPDLRCSDRKTGDDIRGIGEVRVGRAGKLLVVIAGINGPQTMDLLERYVLNGLPEALLWLVSHRYQSRL